MDVLDSDRTDGDDGDALLLLNLGKVERQKIKVVNNILKTSQTSDMV